MQSQSILVDYIVIGERHRALSDDACNRLAASMKQIGLRNPISVRIVDDYVDEDGQVCDGVPVLVAGRHRLEAAKRLGWSHIDCVEVDDDALRAELWEIDENLMRAELTPAQTAQHLARRKEVWEELETAQSSRSFKGRGNVGFAGDVENKVGVPKRTTQMHIARANALGDDIERIQNTSLDKGVELDALARMTPEQRAPYIARAIAGEAVTAREAPSVAEMVLQQVNAIVSAWNRACPEAREIAMQQIDAPVFDRTRAA